MQLRHKEGGQFGKYFPEEPFRIIHQIIFLSFRCHSPVIKPFENTVELP